MPKGGKDVERYKAFTAQNVCGRETLVEFIGGAVAFGAALSLYIYAAIHIGHALFFFYLSTLRDCIVSCLLALFMGAGYGGHLCGRYSSRVCF